MQFKRINEAEIVFWKPVYEELGRKNLMATKELRKLQSYGSNLKDLQVKIEALKLIKSIL